MLSTVLSFIIPHRRRIFSPVKVSAEEFDNLFKVVAANSAFQKQTASQIAALTSSQKNTDSQIAALTSRIADLTSSQNSTDSQIAALTSSQNRASKDQLNKQIEDLARSQDWFEKKIVRLNRHSDFIINTLVQDVQEFFDEYLWTTCGDSWEVEQLTVRNIIFPNSTWYTTWGGIFIANGTANFTQTVFFFLETKEFMTFSQYTYFKEKINFMRDTYIPSLDPHLKPADWARPIPLDYFKLARRLCQYTSRPYTVVGVVCSPSIDPDVLEALKADGIPYITGSAPPFFEATIPPGLLPVPAAVK